MKARRCNHGFTFIEILIALAISSVVMSAIYLSFVSQQRAYATQEQLVVLQQNLRSALYFMEREILMAGYDPTGDAGAGIQGPAQNSIRITKDLTDSSGTGAPDGDTGDINEDVIYALFDADGDGDMDLGRNDLNGAGNELVAENIDVLNFVYLDEDGAVTFTPSEIRSVQICLLARSEQSQPGYINDEVYQNQQGQTIYTPAAGDPFRRKLLIVEVKCRNLGL